MGWIGKDYKVCFPEKRIFISRDHNWAFAAWEMNRLYGGTENATLIHVDAHLDDVWDGISVNGLYEIKSQEDIYSVTEQLKIDNFIWAGFATNAIDNIIYVTRRTNRQQNHNPFDLTDWEFSNLELEPVRELLKRKKYKGLRFDSIEQFAEMSDENIEKHIKNQSIILDLDLDYFNLSDDLHNPILMEAEIIKEHLKYLRDLYDWDLITVAMSPIYCGGEDECWHIYELFLEVFNLNLADAMVW